MSFFSPNSGDVVAVTPTEKPKGPSSPSSSSSAAAAASEPSRNGDKAPVILPSASSSAAATIGEGNGRESVEDGGGGGGIGGEGRGMKMAMVGMAAVRRTSSLVGSPLFNPRRIGTHGSLSFSAPSLSYSPSSASASSPLPAAAAANAAAPSAFFSPASSPEVLHTAVPPTSNSFFFMVSPMNLQVAAATTTAASEANQNDVAEIDGRIASSSSSSSPSPSTTPSTSFDEPASASASGEERISRPPQLFPWTLQSLALPIPFSRAISSIPPETVESFWVQYLTSTPLTKNKVSRDSRTLMRLVALGIPMSFRTSLWTQLALDLISGEGNIQATYQGHLKEAEKPGFESPALKSIEGDLLRTFPEHPDFEDEDSSKIQKMRRILSAYSIRNPRVGYCQGMNFIVGFFLLVGFEEVAAYELLAIFVEHMMAPDYYTEELLGLHLDQEVMQDLLKQQLPRLASHLKKHNIPISLATMNWLLTGFLAVLPFGMCCRIWDLFFLHGAQAFFWVSLALFKFMEDQALGMTNSGEIYTLFVQFPHTLRDSSKLVEMALRFQKQVDPATIQAKRKRYLPKIQRQRDEHVARTRPLAEEPWNMVEETVPSPSTPKKMMKAEDSFELVE